MASQVSLRRNQQWARGGDGFASTARLGGHSGLGRRESEEEQRQKSRNREVLSVFSVFKEQYITQFD